MLRPKFRATQHSSISSICNLGRTGALLGGFEPVSTSFAVCVTTELLRLRLNWSIKFKQHEKGLDKRWSLLNDQSIVNRLGHELRLM